MEEKATLNEEKATLNEEKDALEADLYESMADVSNLRERCRLAEKDSKVAHHGKPYDEVSKKQQQRDRAHICDGAEMALWFAETFGLMPSKLVLKDNRDNDVEVILHNDRCSTTNKESQPDCGAEEESESGDCIVDIQDGGESAEDGNKKAERFEALPQEEKENVRAIAYIMGRFSVSQEAYHELTQSNGGQQLPRSYIVEGCTQSLDSKVNVRKTPGNCHGAEVPFMEALEKEIKRYMESNLAPQEDHTNDSTDEISVKVKIAGDGAQLSRTSSLFVFSFALLDDLQCLSSAGTHTIAAIKGKEDYTELHTSLANVIDDVNALQEKGFIDIDGKKVNVELFLGGDYKFLLIAMGMKAANSSHSCIWCKVSSKQRCDLCLTIDFLGSPQMERVLGRNWAKDPGCHSEPLFRIPVDHVVSDELHMLLRIMDRLEAGIVMAMIDWDEQCAFTNGNRSVTHLQSMVKAIKNCGISFAVWKGKDGKLEWTSLMGNDKKRLLRKLPDKFPELLKPESVEQVTKLWTDFRQIFEIFTSECPTDDQKKNFQPMALQWAKHLLSMNKMAGYNQTNQITLYIHILVYHAGATMEKYGSLKIFSGQGVEKKNDDFRRYFMRKINRWDACASLIRVEKRQEELGDKERVARRYRKTDDQFWFNGGKERAAAQVLRISTRIVAEPRPESNHCEVPTLSADELKRKTNMDLMSILEGLTGPPLAKKLRKCDLVDRILAASVHRAI